MFYLNVGDDNDAVVTSEIKLKQNVLFHFYFSFISDVTTV